MLMAHSRWHLLLAPEELTLQPLSRGNRPSGHSEAAVVPEFQTMPTGSLKGYGLPETSPGAVLVLQCEYVWVQFYGSEFFFFFFEK